MHCVKGSSDERLSILSSNTVFQLCSTTFSGCILIEDMIDSHAGWGLHLKIAVSYSWECCKYLRNQLIENSGIWTGAAWLMGAVTAVFPRKPSTFHIWPGLVAIMPLVVEIIISGCLLNPWNCCRNSVTFFRIAPLSWKFAGHWQNNLCSRTIRIYQHIVTVCPYIHGSPIFPPMSW